MKLFFRFGIILMLVIGFSPYESPIVSANYSENELLTDSQSLELSKILASDIIARIDSVVEKYSTYHRFNGNVLVALSGQSLYSRSVGYADPLKKIPVNNQTIYQLASVSKQFTAAAIMLLNSDGRLNFNDPLELYIPELPYKNITLNNLLHHTSGLPNYMYLLDKYWHADSDPDNEDVVELMAKYKLPFYFKPGARYDYSNTGYVMLATVVERISGLSLNEFLTRRLFQPLGMLNTYVYSTADTAIKRIQADGFRALKRGYARIQDSHHNGPVGDKGICSTIEDMFKWDRALYNESPINFNILEQAYAPAQTNAGKQVPYGYGFRLRECEGCKVVYHNGIWEGFRTNFHRYIQTGNTIIVLNNTSKTNHQLVYQIEQIIAKSNDLTVNSRLVQRILEEGLESALELYAEMNEVQPFAQIDVRKLMQAADFMYSIGKDKKAEEIKGLCTAMVSI